MRPHLSIAALIIAAVASSMVSAEWSLQTALDGVYWSKIAYCYDDNIDTWSCGACPHFPGVTDAKGYHDDVLRDSSGYVAYYPAKDQIIYAFRGTINLPGWIEDFDFFQSPYPTCADTGCKVHQGLSAGYFRVKSGLWDQLEMIVAKHPNSTLFVTGHSMGAAQAGFAFLDVVLNLKNHTGPKMLYDYGSPRLGNPEFVKYMEDTVEPHGTHYRHTNFGDPIPHLAPFFFDDIPDFGQWLHCPREVFFENAFANPRTNPPTICDGNTTMEDPNCADSTPWYDMLGFTNHTTYLDIGLGCFLGDVATTEQAKKAQAAIVPKISAADGMKLMGLLQGKKGMVPPHKLLQLTNRIRKL